MLPTQSKGEPVRSNKVETQRSWLETYLGRSAGSTLMEFGIGRAGVDTNCPIPGLCSRCRSDRNPRSSTAQCPNVFCSEECEQKFLQTVTASLTVEDCIHMHQRLEALLVSAQDSQLDSRTGE